MKRRGERKEMETRSIWHRYKSEDRIRISIGISFALSTLPMNHCDDCKNEMDIKENENKWHTYLVFEVKYLLMFTCWYVDFT